MARGRVVILMGVALAVLLAPAAFGDIRDGLIAYWSVDEGNGDTWNDAVGKHDGEIEDDGDGGWTDDAQFGNGFVFSRSLVRVRDADDINELPDGFTLAHFIRPDSAGAIMDKSGSDATRIQWYILGDKRHHWGLGGSFGFSDNSPVPAFGEWYHFAWSHTPPESHIYRDGEEVAFAPNMGDVPVTDADMFFGNRLPDEGRQEFFGGALDDIGFWNRGLTAEEIAEVAKKGLSGVLAVSPQGKTATTWARLKDR